MLGCAAAGDLRFLKARLVRLPVFRRQEGGVVQQLFDGDGPVHPRIMAKIDLPKATLADDGRNCVPASEQ